MAYELVQQLGGLGTPSCIHIADILVEDNNGVDQKYPADAPMWKYARTVLVGGAGSYVDTAYADDGTGVILDPQPYLHWEPGVVTTWDGINHVNTEGSYYVKVETTGVCVNYC